MNRPPSRTKGEAAVCPACSRSVPHRTYPEGLIPRLADRRAPSDVDTIVFERHGREILEGFISFHLSVEFKSYRFLSGIAE